MKKIIAISAILLFVFCVGTYQKQADLAIIYRQAPKWAAMDMEIYRINKNPPDSSYGYVPENNIKVALRNSTDTIAGPRMEHYYLAHIECVCGGDIEYYKGSCCPVPRKNALFGNMAMLDIYKIRCVKCKKKTDLFVNMYDDDTAIYAPIGYNLKIR